MVRVTVSPDGARADYVRSYLPKDENAQRRNRNVSHSYTMKAQ